jgi:RNA polymerase sigma-70 factor (ECF subfamily)
MKFDSQFISRLRKRETEAFTILYEESETMLYNYVLYRVSGNKNLAEGILSDIFCDAIAYCSSLTPLHNVTAWLLRIAKSKIADHFRKQAKHKKWKSRQAVETVAASKGHGKDPQTRLLEQEHSLLVQTAFTRLTAMERDLLQKKYVKQMSIKQLGMHYGKSEKSIESLLYRARKELKKRLKQLENEQIYKEKRE